MLWCGYLSMCSNEHHMKETAIHFAIKWKAGTGIIFEVLYILIVLRQVCSEDCALNELEQQLHLNENLRTFIWSSNEPFFIILHQFAAG